MTLLFTHEELIQYLYNETSSERTAAIEAALTSDWSLRETLEEIQHSTQVLDLPLESPRAEAVSNILNYARESVAVG